MPLLGVRAIWICANRLCHAAALQVLRDAAIQPLNAAPWETIGVYTP
ncbi:hypothetical protein ACUHMQ_12780 [Chitinimonas sp. PSY-7]